MQKSGIDVALSGDSIPEGENIILISNHQGISDIPVLFKLAKMGKQIGHMKWFIKDVVKYVPGVGWGMLFVDGLFVKRNWFKDKQKIESTFKKFFDHNIPIWLMIFPEGTRFKADKLKLMARIAKSKKLPPLTHVLLPRSKGFVASVQGLRGHCQAIYDVTIIYEEESPSIADLILGKVTKVHVHVKRFEISQLSDDKNDLNNWITERFYIKNEMIAKHQEKKASEVLN
jgi:1-acyl-sn-glycerol-3-phosphate acyltransferase